MSSKNSTASLPLGAFMSTQPSAPDEVKIMANWKRVDIPNARCGDGSKYSVFLNVANRDTDKLLVEIMGGGACWSASSCKTLSLMAQLRNIPNVPGFSYMTWNGASHPWSKHAMIYFPYCTGDVHSTDVVIDYDREGEITYHQGYRNITNALQYLEEQGWVDFKKYRDVTLWGASAGAIGALVHADNLNKHLRIDAKRTLIADSPGLHFGARFWHKFPRLMQDSFDFNFKSLNLNVNFDDGFVAPRMGPVFEKLQNWNIGILQGSKDYLMSDFFGEIEPREHEKLVFSREGIIEVAKKYPNVKTWVPKTFMHTFLLIKPTSKIEDDFHQSGLNFAIDVYKNGVRH